MKFITITLGFLLLINLSLSQIKRKALNGEWYADNDFGKYYKNDTIVFTSRVINHDQVKRVCELIKWEKENRTFKLTEINVCTARAKVFKGFATQKIKLSKTDFGQVIKYYQDKQIVDKFRIIECNKGEMSELKLIRFDKVSEQKVYKYVDSLIFKVLKYNPDADGSENNYGITVSHGNPTIKIKAREGQNLNPKPLIIINGYPVQNIELLKKLLLVETYVISYLTKEQSASLYGSQAKNGVIILRTSEKRFKAIRRKQDR